MKKILVVSDSHKHNQILNQIFAAHQDIDTCIHCGDLQDQQKNLQIKNLYIVDGNTDFVSVAKDLYLNIENTNIYVCHGHQYNIEEDLFLLEKFAKKNNIQLVCFGHTHHAEFFLQDGIYYLNPGSVAFPRGKQILVPSYAIVTLDHGQISCQFYHAKTNQVISKETEKKKKASFFSFFKKKAS